ncbi:MAG: hypothetical protein IT428_15225 [Planctomycetaceae bacterium]|nr:hypothetical protein [Planctomycetaceae bacterium]
MQTETLTIETGATDWAAEAVVSEDGTIVRGVALCGRTSKNGYSFAETAWGDQSRAKSLYEGRPVFIDHTKDASKAFERSSRDLAGNVENVTLRGGRPFGDIRTLPTDAGKLLSAMAKAKPPNVGMSHVAAYRFSENRKVVESIEEVASVDLVVFPATTKSFTEQDRGKPMTTSTPADDKLTLHLENEGKRLTAENTRLTKLVEERDTSLAAMTKERDELKSRVATLEAENKTLKSDADKFAAEKAIAARRVDISAKLKEHGLKEDDAVIVSPAFMESLVSEADAGKRELLIKDRKAVLGAAAKGGNGLGSTERQQGGGGGGTGDFNPENEFKAWGQRN